MSFIAIDADLAAAADEELDRACDLSWRDLSGIIPWGDSYEGVTPAGTPSSSATISGLVRRAGTSALRSSSICHAISSRARNALA